MVFRMLHRGRRRSAMLLLGLLAVSAGAILIASASQTIVVSVDQDISQYWRTNYDILVRPGGARSPVEEKYGLVEANHLSGIWGGITFEQYEAIKSIPDVEVAAPIAMIGYVGGWAQGDEIPFPPFPGVYAFYQTATVDDGSRTYTPPEFPGRWYYYFDRNPQEPPANLTVPYDQLIGELYVNDIHRTVGGVFSFYILMAGIDPPQEAALIGLDRTLLEGQYLTGDESLASQFEVVWINPPFDPSEALINIPVLINVTTYINISHYAELKRVTLPPDVTTLEEILARGGIDYLDGLPSETVAVATSDSQAMYQRMIESILSQSIYFGGVGTSSIPSALVYREAAPFSGHSGLVLEIQLPEDSSGQAEIHYRRPLEGKFNADFIWEIKGIFDIEGLPKPADLSRVPLETYLPPVAILRYDEQGNPVEPPRELRPTLNPAGYIQPPPMMLTTMEAARALRGEAAISAIRVRVGGIDQLTPEAHRKIEAVAIEIARTTGLTVDIMVGSSPTRVLVHVPGIGYVEEQWIQKGINLTYRLVMHRGSWLLLMTLFVAVGLFSLDMAWAEVAARRRVIALQKALGWRSRTVFGWVLRQMLVLGMCAVSIGALTAWGIVWLLDWQMLTPALLLGLPLGVLGAALIGSLLPAWLAGRVPPIEEIQRGGLRYRRSGLERHLSLWSYACGGLMRQPGRTLLAGSLSAFSAALLTLLVAVTLERHAMLSGTLLGEFILVHIEGFHYAIVGIGLGLAVLSTANALLSGVLERRREIGVLKALGWRSRAVAALFVTEGLLLGLAGGAAGALLGGGVFATLYGPGALVPGVGLAIALGVGLPALVGGLAALYPARVAAKVPPAEALRYG